MSRRAARLLREEPSVAPADPDTMPIPTIVRVSPLAPCDSGIDAAVDRVPLSDRPTTGPLGLTPRRPPETSGPSTRREAAAAALFAARPARARHVHRRPRPLDARLAVVASLAVAGVLVGGSAAVTAVVGVSDVPVAAVAAAAPERYVAPIPGPADMPATAPLPVDLCAEEAVQAALTTRTPADLVTAAGGAAVLREEVAAGRASCIPLDDPVYPWVVINKARPLDPLDYRPDGLLAPQGVRNLGGGWLRSDAASALESMVAGAAASGAGEIALESSFRSFQTQQQTYAAHAAARGVEGADAVSARPGFSEHQSGLAIDVVACGGGGCGSLDGLADTPQGAWIAENAWRYGFIVRYEQGRTDVTGYIPEPWHLRFIGIELAAEYHAGGFLSLEEFFGLPPAPDYLR